jgi:formylglycine-generating enzyme required for sulfatase activity
MKMNLKASVFLTATFIFSVLHISAQDSTNNVITLKQLMVAGNVVTNTVGVVLVKISPGLWAGQFETTQSAYKKTMQSNPSTFKGANRPVDSVSWNNATAFCAKLTTMEQAAKELPAGYSYTLPTQSQWMTLMDNATLQDAVMKISNGSSSTAPVGSLGANSLGLYDTRGNVMEWCLDSNNEANRVLKGGAWDTWLDINARPDFNWYAGLDEAKSSYGFRVILSGPAQ